MNQKAFVTTKSLLDSGAQRQFMTELDFIHGSVTKSIIAQKELFLREHVDVGSIQDFVLCEYPMEQRMAGGLLHVQQTIALLPRGFDEWPLPKEQAVARFPSTVVRFAFRFGDEESEQAVPRQEHHDATATVEYIALRRQYEDREGEIASLTAQSGHAYNLYADQRRIYEEADRLLTHYRFPQGSGFLASNDYLDVLGRLESALKRLEEERSKIVSNKWSKFHEGDTVELTGLVKDARMNGVMMVVEQISQNGEIYCHPLMGGVTVLVKPDNMVLVSRPTEPAPLENTPQQLG